MELAIAHRLQLSDRDIFHAPRDVGHTPALQGASQPLEESIRIAMGRCA
jgi:hypothetical protein